MTSCARRLLPRHRPFNSHRVLRASGHEQQTVTPEAATRSLVILVLHDLDSIATEQPGGPHISSSKQRSALDAAGDYRRFGQCLGAGRAVVGNGNRDEIGGG